MLQYYFLIFLLALGIVSAIPVPQLALATANACPFAFFAPLLESFRMAKSRYEQAISTAKRNGFIQDAALAHERAGIFFLAQDDASWGKYHIEKWVDIYRDWSCTAKATHLTEKYSDLLSS